MIVENLTQRDNEFKEESGNLILIKKFLQSACSLSEQAKRKDTKDIRDAGSIRDVYNWLNQNGEISHYKDLYTKCS